MGLGTTRKKLVGFTVVQRMVEDDSYISSERIGLLKYLAANATKLTTSVYDRNLVSYIRESRNSALPAAYKRAYNYAKSGQYAYGLPTAANITVHEVNLNQTIKDYLEAQLGHSVSMVYTKLGDANYYHFMWKKLIDQYGYNPTTNELSTFSTLQGFPCYLSTAKVSFGYYTVNAYTNGMAMYQEGFSTESGECLSRIQDLNAALVPADVDTNVDDAYVVGSYKYIEVIPDVTPPPEATVNTLTTTSIVGFAEKDSQVAIYVNTVLQDTVVAASDGYFTYNFTPPLTAGAVVKLVVIDAASNTSSGLDTVVPYTNPSPATVGTDKTITEIEHTVSFDFNFLDYISTTKPVVPAEFGETPTVVVGDDSYAPDYDFIQACYTYDVLGTTHIEYFTYAYGSNTNLTLEALFTTGAAFAEYYPRLYLRLNQEQLVDTLSETSNEYRSSKRIAKLLGMDWKEVSDNVATGIVDAGQDLAEVKQVFMTLAVSVNTSDIVLQEYLYRYWEGVYNNLTVPVATIPESSFASRQVVVSNGKQGITFQVADNVYNHIISFVGMTRNVITGSIGTVGSFNSTYINEYEITAESYVQDNGSYSYFDESSTPIHPAHHVFRFQNTPTTYIEFAVYNLRSIHNFANTTTTAMGTDANLIIPLDRTLIQGLTIQERELLFNKSLILFINVAKIIKIKWYQHRFFSFLLNALAVAVFVFTIGQGVKVSGWLITLAKAIGVVIATKLIIKLLVLLGVDVRIASVIALILAAASGYAKVGNTALLGLNAVQLLQATSFAFQISAKLGQYYLKKLTEEMELFSFESEQKSLEIQKARELLNNGLLPVEYELLLPNARNNLFITLGESFDDFLAKTPVNNPDLLVYLLSNYVDILLQPPTLQQMLNLKPKGDDYESILI